VLRALHVTNVIRSTFVHQLFSNYFSAPVDLSFAVNYRRRPFADQMSVNNMSREMMNLSVQLICARPNGQRPLVDARPAHGSGSA
jgi:hypothetical protein